MSRSTTTGSAPQTKAQQTASTPQSNAMQSGINMDKIAMLAYQKWLKGGCKHGCDKQHWFEAEAELKAEMSRTGSKK